MPLIGFFRTRRYIFKMRRNQIRLAQKHDFVRVIVNVLEKLDVP